MLDMLIRGGSLIDGTGAPRKQTDVGVSGEKVSILSKGLVEKADKIIDAEGLIIAPGFIDSHSHSDLTAIFHHSGERSLKQGITTEIVGNCGLSAAPLSERNRDYWRKYMAYLSQAGLSGFYAGWSSFTEFLERLSSLPLGSNLAFLVGHNTLRSMVMGIEGEGGERREPSDDQLNEMKSALDNSMKAGAFGLSSGLTYPPGRNASKDELTELCSVVATHDGVYASHLRGGNPAESLKEFLDVVRGSGVRGIASHLRGRVISYPGGTSGDDPSIQAMLIQEARLEGHEVFVDVIPIVSGLNSLVGVLFGGWGITDFSEIFDDEGKMVPIKTFVHKLSDIQKKKLVSEKARAHASSTGLYTRGDTRLIHYSPSHPEFMGKSVSEAAESFGLNVLDAIIKLTIDDCGDTRWGNTCLENDLKALFSYDFTMPCTDGYWLPYSAEIPSMAAIPGPRIYGSFPYFLKTYQSDSLAIEKVVEKMTSLPAQAFRLKGRGVLKEGAYADIVVLDPIQISNNATYKNPMIPPSGIKYVIVNGTLAYSKGALTTGAGKVLKNVHDV